MLKGKLKYILLGLGVLIVAFSIFKSTSYARMFNIGPRGHHSFSPEFREKFIEEYGEDNWDGFRRYHHGGYRRGHHREGCRSFYYDDYQFEDEVNK